MSGQSWVPWVGDPHIKAKGLGKKGKLAQEEWNVNEIKVNAPGFCLGEEDHRGDGSRLGDNVHLPCLRMVVARLSPPCNFSSESLNSLGGSFSSAGYWSKCLTY